MRINVKPGYYPWVGYYYGSFPITSTAAATNTPSKSSTWKKERKKEEGK